MSCATSVSSVTTCSDRPVLSDREIEVLRAWVTSESKHAAATGLFISETTVNTHITRVRYKYEQAGRPAHCKASLLARALQDGHIMLDEL